MTKILQARNKQKLNEFEPTVYISVITDINKKWFVIFELTINHLSFGYGRLLQLEYHLFCFLFFFNFFSSSLTLSPFKPLNRLYLKF